MSWFYVQVVQNINFINELVQKEPYQLYYHQLLLSMFTVQMVEANVLYTVRNNRIFDPLKTNFNFGIICYLEHSVLIHFLKMKHIWPTLL